MIKDIINTKKHGSDKHDKCDKHNKHDKHDEHNKHGKTHKYNKDCDNSFKKNNHELYCDRCYITVKTRSVGMTGATGVTGTTGATGVTGDPV